MKRSGKGPRLGEVNRAAKAGDVDRKTIQRYLREGLPVGPNGKIADKDVEAFKNRKAATIKGGVVATRERNEWSMRKERAQALYAEKKLALEMGELGSIREFIRERVEREMEFKDRWFAGEDNLLRRMVGKSFLEMKAILHVASCEYFRCLARKGSNGNEKDSETEGKKK